MKEKISESVKFGEGVTAEIKGQVLTLKAFGKEISKSFRLPKVTIKVESDGITFSSEKATKRELKLINSSVAHVDNMISGLKEDFTYVLEACNVHFPMTLKLEKNILLINNFLGEKTPRKALIHPAVKAEIKGQKIVLTSHNKEALGETVSNMEKATKIRNRDRRIFQDGIYLVERPERS